MTDGLSGQDPDRLSPARVRQLIAELVADYPAPWSEAEDWRADAIARHLGPTRWLAPLVGTKLFATALALQSVDGRPVPLTYDRIHVARRSAMRLYGPRFAAQVVTVAAKNTEIRRLDEFEEHLRAAAWNEMQLAARSSEDYIVVACRLNDAAAHDAVVRSAFRRLSPLQVVSFLSVRPTSVMDEAGELLSAEEVAIVSGSKVKAVNEACSKARGQLKASILP